MTATGAPANLKRSFVLHAEGPDQPVVIQDLLTLERARLGSLDDVPQKLRACLEAHHAHRTTRTTRALTDAEGRVAALAADGVPNKGIASALGVSLRTVESHLTSAYRKLGLKSRAELVEAYDEGQV